MDLLNNLDKVHTTEMGVDRIKRNIEVDVDDIVAYCIEFNLFFLFNFTLLFFQIFFFLIFLNNFSFFNNFLFKNFKK